MKGNPLRSLTSSGSYWKKQTTKTEYFVLRQMGEKKTWITKAGELLRHELLRHELLRHELLTYQAIWKQI